MSRKQSQQSSNIGRAFKKFFLSGFVVFTFVAYVIEQRFTKPDSAIALAPTVPSLVTHQADSSVNPLRPSGTLSIPTAQPTATANSGLYKDGVYTGPQVDAYYGLVEVQVTVKGGRISDIQFLEYPNDQRTSVRINTIAMPYLQQEALQAQSARVNIISGATFTSEGFAISLNEALKSAKN